MILFKLILLFTIYIRYNYTLVKRYNKDIKKYEYVGSRNGQLMHHFVSLIPTYESLAGYF